MSNSNEIVKIGVALKWRSTYDSEKTYYQDNITTLGGSVFRCKATSITGKSPMGATDEKGHLSYANTDVWDVVVDMVQYYNWALDSNLLANETLEYVKKAVQTATEAKEASVAAVSQAQTAVNNANAAIKSANAAAEKTQAAIDRVNAAAEMAETMNDHPMIPGDNGNWWRYDLTKKIYVDTGLKAQGNVLYPYLYINEEDMTLMMAYNNDMTFRLLKIDDDGYLCILQTDELESDEETDESTDSATTTTE